MVVAAVAQEVPSEPFELSDAYRFCHEQGVDYEQAKPFCLLVEHLDEEQCAGLRATCDGVETETPAMGCAQGVGLPTEMPTAPPAPQTPPETPDWQGCEVEKFDLSGLMALMKWVAAGFVAALILVVARLIWAGLAWTLAREESAAPPASSSETLEDDLEDVPEVPSEDLLAEARAALEAGDFGRAVMMSRNAALRHLHLADRIVLHRSRTDREYARAVRAHPQIHQDLGVVLSAVERVRWAGWRVGPAAARDILSAAQRVLAIAFVAALLFSSSSAASDRYGPVGDAALFELMTAEGYHVSWRLRGLSDLSDETTVLVLDLTGVAPTEEDHAAIRAWVEGGGLLVVAGDPVSFPELGSYELLAGAEYIRRAAVVRAAGLSKPRFAGGPEFAWFNPGGTPWVGLGTSREVNAGRPRAAVVQHVVVGHGAVLGVADPRLLWNGSLVHPDNVSFWTDVPRVGAEVGAWALPDEALVEFATWSGASSETPMDTLMNSRLLPFVLHLLFWWALVVMYKGRAFGGLKDPPGEGRLVFGDHALALASHWQSLRAGTHAWSRYAALWVQRLGGRGVELAALRSGYSSDAARDLARRVQEAADKGGHGGLDEVEELWNVTRHH